MILMLCMAATAAYAQTDRAGTATSSADSLRMDSIIHALPEVMVKGERPTVKVAGSKRLEPGARGDVERKGRTGLS